MSDSIRNLCRLAVLAAGLAFGAQAQAATATLDCGTGTPQWNSSSNTLTCVAGGGTQCSISGPTSAVVNTSFQLTASCPSGTGPYTWTGTGGASSCTGATCDITEASTGNKTYTVDNAASTPSSNYTVNVSSGPVPNGCSLTASPTSGTSAQNVTLTANCSSGADPITIAWGGTGASANCTTTTMNIGTPVQCTIPNVSATTTWTASFSNANGQASSPSNPRTATFTYNAGGGGAFAGCPAGTMTIDGQWGNSAIMTADYGTFGGQILSIRVAVPSTWSSSSTKTSSWVEYQDAGSVREAVFSKFPCDFTTANALKTSLGIPARSVDTIDFQFKYKSGSSTTSAVGLTPGTAYYINVRNYYSNGVLACTSGSCNMRGGLPQ